MKEKHSTTLVLWVWERNNNLLFLFPSYKSTLVRPDLSLRSPEPSESDFYLLLRPQQTQALSLVQDCERHQNSCISQHELNCFVLRSPFARDLSKTSGQDTDPTFKLGHMKGTRSPCSSRRLQSLSNEQRVRRKAVPLSVLPWKQICTSRQRAPENKGRLNWIVKTAGKVVPSRGEGCMRSSSDEC